MPSSFAARFPLVLAFALAASAAAGAPSAAAAGEKGGVFPEVEEVQKPEEAKSLADALAKAVESKDEAKVVEALKPMVGKRHKDFVPELKKLVLDRRVPVAAAAAAALGSQGDKGVSTLLVKTVSAESRDKEGTIKDGALKAAAIESLGRLGITGGVDAILKLAEQMLREPDVHQKCAPEVVRAIVRYLGLTKEKRGVSILIDEVEQPSPQAITGTTPPEAYWKSRHDIWAPLKADAIWALKEITGKEFETRRRWMEWFKSDGQKEGMK